MNTLATVDRGLAAHLVAAALEQGSGIVNGGRGKLKRVFCLDQGLLAYAASNLIEEQFPQLLVRRGCLAAADLPDALSRSKADGLPLARFLLEREILTGEALQHAMEEHVRRLLFSTLDWQDGAASFAKGRPDLEGELTVGLSCVSLLLEYARSHPASIDMTRVRIGPPDCRPLVAASHEALLDAFEPDRAATYLLEQCNGSRPVAELVARSPCPAEDTWRSLYGLMLIGVLSPAARGKRPDPSQVLASREEVEARLHSAEGADHYAVLELNASCSREDIRDAYYFLARRYHPDRFRSGRLKNLREKIEAYFAQVTEAYNTLYNPDSRADYDEFRASTRPAKEEPEQDTVYLAKQNYLRAKALIEKGRYTDAVTSLENAIQLNAGEASYHLELGRLLARNPRRRKDAEDHLIEANQLDPALSDGYLALGELYLKLDRLDDAARLFREVLRWEPGHLEATAQLKALGESVDEGGLLRGLFKG